MAIDTAERRRAARYVTTRRSPAVTPNAAQDVEWRQESGWGYPGITPVGPPAAPVGVPGGQIKIKMGVGIHR